MERLNGKVIDINLLVGNGWVAGGCWDYDIES